MTAWLVFLGILLVALLGAGAGSMRGRTDARIVALMFSGELATLTFLALAAIARHDYYIDCALVAALLPYPSSIVFAHFFERWL